MLEFFGTVVLAYFAVRLCMFAPDQGDMCFGCHGVADFIVDERP